MPKNECDIDSGSVDSARQDYDNLFSKISGRSGEYNLITEPVSFDFSGLVAENLRSAANENQSAWQSSLSACSLAFGVLSEVYEAVVEYDEKLDDIQARYSSYVKNLGDTLQPDSITVMQSFQTEADTALTNLRTRCDWAEEKLESGATPESMRALAAAGHFGEYGQIGYYINEDLNYYHVDETQAETIAVHLRDGVLEGRGGSIEALEDNPELLALITNVALRANTAERNGEKLTDGEIAFLETIHDELEIGEDGFLDFLDQVKSSEHISDSLREEINRSLANGTLALSNEAVGGGVDLLPNDIQETIIGPEGLDLNAVANGGDSNKHLDDYRNWGPDFIKLGEYLSSSSPGVKGGTEFSATLLATTAVNIGLEETYSGGPDEVTYQEIMNVAARNPEANNIMLTGEDFEGNSYEHHERHEKVTPEYFLESIYTRDWPDDGQAASKVTDWIEIFQNSDDPEEVDQGSEALIELLDIITSPEMEEILGNTGHDIEDEDNDVIWRDVSFTNLNPEIANSFADIFLNNVEAMESVAGFSIDPRGVAGPSIHEVENKYMGDGLLQIDPMARLIFAEYIVGNEQAAARLEAAAYFRTEEAAATYFGDSSPNVSSPRSAGIFNAIIEKAIESEHQARIDSTNAEIDYKNQVSSNSTDMVSAVFNEIPVPGVSTLSELMKQGFKDVVKIDPVDVARDTSSDISVVAVNNRSTLHTAFALEESGEYEFGDEVDYLRDPKTGNINLDPNHWIEDENFDEVKYQDVIDFIRQEISGGVWHGGEGKSVDTVTAEFREFYKEGAEALGSRT
ncbi:hypothetical protein ABZ617_16880 [Nocardiopsis alba]|uniref:TPR repeat region-containing protein n=1 Tax=Nocardiopsis alba TaxID=53437 RepID=UPI0033D277D6